MAQMLTAVFPDRETAEHAMSRLQAIGLQPARMNAEDFERPEYYTNQMPQGATMVSVDAAGHWDEAQRIVVETGGRVVEAVAEGKAGMPTARTGDVAGSVPVPDEERHAFAEKAQDNRMLWREERDG
ncbi:MAG TPA: hypothetical protein VHB98_08960 [Chloroflexota bacterium]|nr:hypothetical protein [Chloroflexota bacterium]